MENNNEKDKKDNNLELSTSENEDPFFNNLIFNKYKPVKKLGEGSFGKVYKVEYNGEYFALKIESSTRQKSLLEMENNIMT